MYEKKCAICGSRDVTTLEIEYEPGETYAKYICHSCWDVIAEVAGRVAKHMIKESEIAAASVPIHNPSEY